MPQTAEATGRTLDDAKRAAAESLGVAVGDCEFEVLEEAAKGLFAKTNYRVRATAAGKEEAAPEPEKPAAEKPARKPVVRKPKAAPAVEEEAKPEVKEGEAEATDADSKAALEMMSKALELTGLDITASVDGLSGRYVNLKLDGVDVERLVGEKGSALDSLQYLANAMLGRTLGGGVRLTLDAGGYRSSRAAALEELARDVAAAVVEREQEAVLDALPAHERRVIHNALKDFDGVDTYSEGEEPARRVVVSPKKN
ncbi:MAG: Jag N-terminal domain-containing protein [Armatimonadetes bacterium]|nr:Jag N-terminal domain-containing protein [Armatimonadota bacterium]